ncbi:MAG TPA: hypothetical protein VFL95_00835 [Gemmatimonadales bacterium]|nr:hypothetical protein [Gemmatimonadales bacterium]
MRGWRIGAALVVVAIALAGWWFWSGRGRRWRSPNDPAAVRAWVTLAGDSLQVVIYWRAVDNSVGPLRSRVTFDQSEATVQHPVELAGSDTTWFVAPEAGITATGQACIENNDARNCTPWQFVRPAARAGSDSELAHPGTRIVIRPEGMQVDPDIGGRCTAWRQAHPDSSPWVSINQQAVPSCTGPNGQPTLAKFCAFAVLPDGRRVKTGASRNNAYCDQLFRRWVSERAL